ncbi:unnamed protein product [Cuscuta europaea]|uniref:Uncharacterized protein n=1 Tax=Cuscuta europaea TaxID=41803 RepID=A0A9P0Z104_CUSEU|nr:unnamed protein product [Cuscuta europaea]
MRWLDVTFVLGTLIRRMWVGDSVEEMPSAVDDWPKALHTGGLQILRALGAEGSCFRRPPTSGAASHRTPACEHRRQPKAVCLAGAVVRLRDLDAKSPPDVDVLSSIQPSAIQPLPTTQ